MAGEGLQASNEFLLDTGIIIRYLRQNKRAADLLDYLESLGEIAVSTITYMEIMLNSQPGEELVTELLFDRITPLAVSREVAEKGASLIRKYPMAFGKNNPRGFPDALIAATAWEQGSTLITLNTRHFTLASISEVTIRAIDQNAPSWVAVLKS